MQEALSLIAVLVTDICVAGAVCALYALGVRMWAHAAAGDGTEAHPTARIAAVCCFAACAAIISALYLMVPAFH